MKYVKYLYAFWVVMVMLAVTVAACSSHKSSAAVSNTARVQHNVEIGGMGKMIYLDRISNRSVLQDVAQVQAGTTFHSFRIGFTDSLYTEGDKKRDLAKGRYLGYEMEKDWRAIVNGDSIMPVFFPRAGRGRNTSTVTASSPEEFSPQRADGRFSEREAFSVIVLRGSGFLRWPSI